MSTATIDAAGASGEARSERRPDTWLLHHRADRRQIAIVTLYFASLLALYFAPACRTAPMFVAACALSFLNAVVIHNHLHKGIFKSKGLNRAFRCVLSFGALYPASANIASHNLVHHHFDDDGQPDWASPSHARVKWNLLNLLHFPNIIGPITFAGINRWASVKGRADYRRQSMQESVFAFGLTGLLLAYDFWTVLFFVLVPQLWGARWFLRVNIIQHDGCDISSEYNHSRNFGGALINWFAVNAGYHTAHHNKPGLHWSELAKSHQQEVAPKMDPSLLEPSLLGYLARTYVFRISRPQQWSPPPPIPAESAPALLNAETASEAY
jgi:fatty acid desaturase